MTGFDCALLVVVLALLALHFLTWRDARRNANWSGQVFKILAEEREGRTAVLKGLETMTANKVTSDRMARLASKVVRAKGVCTPDEALKLAGSVLAQARGADATPKPKKTPAKDYAKDKIS